MAVAELTVSRPGADPGWLTARRARTLGWTAFAIGTALRVVQLWLTLRMGPGSVEFRLDIGVPTFLAAIVLGTASSVVGALIVARHPTNTVGWLYVFTGIAQGFATVGLAYAALTLRTSPDAVGTFAVWFNGVVDFTIPFAFAAIVLTLFPDGRVLGPRWRWVIAVAIAGGIVRTLEVGFGEPAMVLLAGSVNPYRLPGAASDLLARSSALGIGSLAVEGAFVLSVASLVARYRAAPVDGRRQIRWIVLAGVLAVLSTVPVVVETIVPGSLPAHFDALSLLFLALSLAPVATLIAITRYRLYEIDRIVNRALLYGSLTAILAGIFTAGISLAQRLFIAMTGVSNDAAIVLTTLVVATLYAPLRKRLETIVDRRFKFDQMRFGAYRHEVSQILSVVDPDLAAARLIREAVTELGASGGAILARNGDVTASSGAWPAPIVGQVAIDGGSKGLATIVLAARQDGLPLGAEDLAELGRVARMVALAIRGPATTA